MMTAHWYALRSKPRKEDVVWRLAKEQGVEVFYPRLRINPVNPRARKVKPYFPGYLFVQVDLADVGQSVFQWMPHTLGIVSFGGEPARVPDNLIPAIKQKLEIIAAAGGEAFLGLHPGDKVHIHDGPFRGYEAIFDEQIPGSQRVRVLLSMLGHKRVVPVELGAGQIRQIKKRI